MTIKGRDLKEGTQVLLKGKICYVRSGILGGYNNHTQSHNKYFSLLPEKNCLDFSFYIDLDTDYEVAKPPMEIRLSPNKPKVFTAEEMLSNRGFYRLNRDDDRIFFSQGFGGADSTVNIFALNVITHVRFSHNWLLETFVLFEGTFSSIELICLGLSSNGRTFPFQGKNVGFDFPSLIKTESFNMKFEYADKYVQELSDIPKTPHWAIIKVNSIYIPAQGHGYPESTDTAVSYEVYLTEEKWKNNIKYRAQEKDYHFIAIHVRPANITLEVNIL